MMNDLCLQIDGHVQGVDAICHWEPEVMPLKPKEMPLGRRLLPFQGEGNVCAPRYPRRRFACRWAESLMPRWGDGLQIKERLEKAKAISPMAKRSDALGSLMDEGLLEIEGEYKNRKYKRKKG